MDVVDSEEAEVVAVEEDMMVVAEVGDTVEEEEDEVVAEEEMIGKSKTLFVKSLDLFDFLSVDVLFLHPPPTTTTITTQPILQIQFAKLKTVFLL